MQSRTPTARQPRKTSRADGRRWNLLTTLQTIASQGTTSRAEVARLTGLTRPTVSTLVTDLIDEGLVLELGLGEPTSTGKPPTMLGINPTGRQIVAIDLSQQPARGALVNLDGSLGHVASAPGSAVGPAAVESAISLIDTCLAHASGPILGIGVGTPGMIDHDGTISLAAHLDWHDVPLASLLGDRFGLPVVVGNDAHVAALAQLQSNPEDADTLLLVAVGTGIGAGMVLDGTLHTGQHQSFGEIGHVVVDPDGAACRCGLAGCLETVASVPAIARIGDDFDPVDLERAGHRLGATLAVVVSAIDVDRIVLAGELATHAAWVDAVGDEVRGRIHPARRGALTVTASTTTEPVLAGAAAAVMGDVLGVVLR
ncbi:MAG TPA: ROK family transcriptional regulator [Nitriliruptoraceae bacterium]|nr:ROK family transcriptional regulator [Nitriliruptoraceae bacterium]